MELIGVKSDIISREFKNVFYDKKFQVNDISRSYEKLNHKFS